VVLCGGEKSGHAAGSRHTDDNNSSIRSSKQYPL